ncbi:MAG: ribosome biogenesis GTPase Der [Nitrospirae bacterium]|nr:ribosome biogenesis GTPase Der [Nitrospirota bacterium]
MKKQIVAIIGRPNVGKSTLFNRIIEERLAIVEDTPGVTRDRHYAPCSINNRELILVDTGGLEPGATEGLLPQMRVQTEIALDEADFIFFVLDNKEGLLPSDREIHDLLRKAHKPVFYVVNKVDGPKAESGMAEFFSLGVGKLYPVSAEHGRGVDDLLEDLCRLIPSPVVPASDSIPDESIALIPRVAVVGRPNVGKSTLVNTLLREERLVTSPTPGTTRDSIDTLVTYHKKKYCFVDTAGIRRKSRVDRGSKPTVSSALFEASMGAISPSSSSTAWKGSPIRRLRSSNTFRKPGKGPSF